MLLAAGALAAAGPIPTASAADGVLTNNGFESELSGWTQFGVGGNVATTERAFSGARSAKLVDSGTASATGLESTRVTAAAGKYAAFARVHVLSGVPDLYLRFYNSSGTLVGNHFASFSGTTGSWATLRVTGTAPSGTTRASALLYSSKANTGTAYFDDVAISQGITNLGVQINNSMMNATTFGIGSNQDKIYGIFTGTGSIAAKFATIDVDTETVVGATHPLTGATGGWASTTATDGTVYVGTYSNGSVYRHVPGSGTVTHLGKAMAGESFVWTLTSGADGRIYGGTYDSAGYFKYEPANGFTTLGSTPIWPDKHYVRSIAFDESQGATYLGVGTNAALIRFDRVTGAKQDILPDKYSGSSMVGYLTFTGGRLFAGMATGELSVLNVVKNANGSVTATEEATLPAAAGHVSPARNGKVYLVANGSLMAYDIAARTFTPTGVTTSLAPTRLGWVSLADQVTFPGGTLVVVGTDQSRTHLLKFNPGNGSTRTAQIAGTPLMPTVMRAVGAGPDGKIYSGGYLTGGTGVYHPLQGDTNDGAPDVMLRGLSQTDSILGHNGKVYFGNYPHAVIHEYDPSLAWSTGTNPRSLGKLSSLGQDRPYALAAGGGRLFAGTVPKYGAYDGALTVFDLSSGAYTVHRNFVPDQSVISLAYHNGVVYGGTSIRGALGVHEQPRATSAKFFSYNVSTGVKTEYSLSLGGGRVPTAITAVAVVDGRIWGLAEGHLFIFNPATGAFSTAPVQKFSADYRPYGTWSDAAFALTPRDPASVYVTIGSALYRITKSSLAVTQLATGAKGLTVDEYGSLYYYNDVNLYRYLP